MRRAFRSSAAATWISQVPARCSVSRMAAARYAATASTVTASSRPGNPSVPIAVPKEHGQHEPGHTIHCHRRRRGVALQGCLAKTAVSAVTLPGQGRRAARSTPPPPASPKPIRSAAARSASARSGWASCSATMASSSTGCQDGNRRACDQARLSYAEMQQLAPSKCRPSNPRLPPVSGGR